jgi:hypothetical protein
VTSFPSVEDAARIAKLPVVDEDGERLGVIEALFADNDRGTLEWAAVDVGLLARRHLVPLADAFIGPGFLQVGYPKRRVERAPLPDEGDDIEVETERALYVHYGLPWEDESLGSGHEPDGGDVDGAHRILVRRPSLLERLAYT